MSLLARGLVMALLGGVIAFSDVGEVGGMAGWLGCARGSVVVRLGAGMADGLARSARCGWSELGPGVCRDVCNLDSALGRCGLWGQRSARHGSQSSVTGSMEVLLLEGGMEMRRIQSTLRRRGDQCQSCAGSLALS